MAGPQHAFPREDRRTEACPKPAAFLPAPGKRIPAGELWAGMPAKKMRDLDAAALEGFRRQVAHYARNAQLHRESLKDL